MAFSDRDFKPHAEQHWQRFPVGGVAFGFPPKHLDFKPHDDKLWPAASEDLTGVSWFVNWCLEVWGLKPALVWSLLDQQSADYWPNGDNTKASFSPSAVPGLADKQLISEYLGFSLLGS